jgi:hypothetical protein
MNDYFFLMVDLDMYHDEIYEFKQTLKLDAHMNI